MTINKPLMLRLHHKAVHYTCMLRESLTSTQVSLQFTTIYYHDSNIIITISQNYLQGIKFLLLINALEYASFYYILFGCLSYLGLISYHTPITKLFRESQNDISE